MKKSVEDRKKRTALREQSTGKRRVSSREGQTEVISTNYAIR
jgi:hypothetical protein